MKAFPSRNTTEEGMDLRDYFAAKAMQAMLPDVIKAIQTTNDLEKVKNLKKSMYEATYVIADDMMEARK